MTNMALINKVDGMVADLNNSKLIGEQARTFIQDAVAASVLQKFCRTVTIPDGKKIVPRLGFGQRILRRAIEGQALPEAQRSKPTFDSMVLETFPFMATVRLSYEAMEENIEKWGIEGSIKKAMASRIGLDVDDLVMNSNTASTDAFFNAFNGMRAAAGHNLDQSGVAYGQDVMREMMKAMPKQFKNDKALLAFFCSTDSAETYGHELAGRATALGDKYIEGNAAMFYNAARVLDSSVIPEDLGIAPNYRTESILVNPQNAVIGYKEMVQFESTRDIEARMWIIVATIWVAFAYENPLGAVRAYNIGL